MGVSGQATREESRKAGFKVLLCFLAFFGVCIAVNTVFVYEAVTTFRGETAANPYQTGLHYNDILKEARERKHEEQRRP